MLNILTSLLPLVSSVLDKVVPDEFLAKTAKVSSELK